MAKRRLLAFIYPMRFLFILICLLCCTGAKAADSLYVKVDTVEHTLRSIDTTTLTRYKNDPAFNYSEQVVPVGWWEIFKQWLNEFLQRLFSSRGSAIAFKWFIILVGVTALLLLIYKLAGMDLMHIFTKKQAAQMPEQDTAAENIHIIDFNEEIRAAIEKGNFRLAVRLLYLQSLKILTDKQLIDWQPDKTNQRYIDELNEAVYQAHFAHLTGQFEYIWYGGFSVREADFGRIRQDFITFNQSVKA